MKNYDKVLDIGLYGYLEGTDRQSNGSTFFVDGNSGNAANISTGGQGSSWDLPFANINYAISQCSNDAGDVILVAANHTETIADTNDSNVSGTTTDEFCVDKAGITIIGMGTGTRRPKITLNGATDACIDVRSPNCTLYNLVFYNTQDGNTAMIDVQAAAVGFKMENCLLYTSAADAEPILHVNLTTGLTDVTIRGCRFYNVAAGDQALSAICAEGAVTRMVIEDNVFRGDWNEELIQADTAQGYDWEIVDNVINNLDAAYGNAIYLHANTTGVIKGNHIHCPLGSREASVIADGCLVSDNWITRNEGQDTVQSLGHNAADNIANHWYVDSGVGKATGDGKSWESALSTVDAAIALCTESNGDVIHVAPGHAENVGTAGIVGDKAGITILGHGTGESRPTLTFTTNAAAAITVTSNSIRLENLRLACNITQQNHIVDVDGDDCQIINCEFVEGGAEPLSCITSDTGDGDGHGDGLHIEGCRFYLPSDGVQNNAICIGKDLTGVVIKNNYIMGNFDNAAIEIPAGGNASQDMVIQNNIIINEQTGIHCIEVEQTELTVTGICANNILVNDTREACLQPNILNCYGNIWMALGGNVRPVILEGDLTTPGQNIYVDSGHAQAVDDTAHGTSWDFPCATIDYAVALCTANNNDIIHVAPGHEETLSDTVFLTLDVIGITVKGYGSGSDRPTITYDHADGEVVFAVDNITFENFILRPSVDAVTNGIIFSDGADNCIIRNCDFGFPVTATDEFAAAIITGDASNNFLIDNCKFMAGAQAAVVAIDIVKDTDHSEIRNCVFTGAYSTCPIRGQTTASTYLNIHDNVFMCTGATDTFNLVAASTGFIHHNTIVMNAASAEEALDVGNCWCIENYLIADDDVGGAKCGIADVDFASVAATADDE